MVDNLVVAVWASASASVVVIKLQLGAVQAGVMHHLHLADTLKPGFQLSEIDTTLTFSEDYAL